MIKGWRSLGLLILCLVGCVAIQLAAPTDRATTNRSTPHRSHPKTIQENQANTSARSFHLVKHGDTLYDLARANHTSVQLLKQVNQLRTNRLQIGQRLVLPSSLDSLTAAKKKSPSVTKDSDELSAKRSDVSETAGGSTPDKTVSVSLTGEPNNNATTLSAPTADTVGQPTLRTQLIQAGMDFLGVRYRWKGMSEKRGFDCSGLVKTLFDKFEINLPHSAREQFRLGERVAKAELEIGDLVFFSTRGKIPTHVGVYIGDDQFIHAARRARQVIVSNLSQAWYQKRFLGARRMSDLWKDEQKPVEAKGN
jgi:peptidoglycan endopeptidase LytE